MRSSLKKTFLTAAFASAALLSGCSSKPDAANPAPEKARPTAGQVIASAKTYFETHGATLIKTDSCDYTWEDDSGCRVIMASKQDDGLLYTGSYWIQHNSFDTYYCNFRPSDGTAGKIMADLRAKFDADARRKFTDMEFTVLGGYDEPSVGAVYTGTTCTSPMAATYLVRAKATDGLYTADYKETFETTTGARISGGIDKITSIDGAAKPKRAAASPGSGAQPEQQPADDSGERPASRSHSDSSPICTGACTGPHIDLQTGKVKTYGTGPGYKLY